MNFDNKIFFDSDISLDSIKGKKIGVIGYGSQGRAQALNLRDSGMSVVVSLKPESGSIKRVRKDNLKYVDIKSLIKLCDIVCLMIPDLEIISFLNSNIKLFSEGQTILLSHGYAIVYGKIKIPKNVNIVMVAPSGGGQIVRAEYKRGFGVPALVASHDSASDNSLGLALSYAKAIGSSKAAVFLSTFKEETETDLFGEQVILTGSIPIILIESYKVLLEEGYDPVVAWFVCFYELKTIVDLMFQKGINSFYDMVSSTARYGGLTRGKKLINNDFKDGIRKVLSDIKSGEFNKELERSLSRGDDGGKNFKKIFNSKDFNKIERFLLKKIKG